MNAVKLGLIGAGWVAERHLEAIARVDSVEVVGITSRTRDKATSLATSFSIPVVADSLVELVETTSPDALMVLVSEEGMLPVTREALEFGLPVFVEKPAGLVPSETRELVEKARALGVGTLVGFNRRFYSIFRKGLEIIAEHGPLMGVVVEGHERFWKQQPGGKFSGRVLDEWIYANSVHTIDLLRFFGGEVSGLNAIDHRYREPHGDNFAAVMELSSGAIGTYYANWYSPGGWSVRLFGDGVTVEFRPLEEGRWLDRAFAVHLIEPDEDDAGGVKPGFVGQMRAFAEFVRTGVLSPPALDLEGSLATMLLAESICANPEDRSL